MKQFLLGFDIGTTNSKGLVVDTDLGVVATASIPHGVSTPYPGWAEHDAAEVWWGEFVTIVREMLSEPGLAPDRIVGIGISGLAPCVLPLDAAGDPLRPGILYGVDTRSGAEVDHLTDRIGEDRLTRVCGNGLSFQSAGAKLLWYKRNEPDRYARTKVVVDAVGYVVSQLTGEYVMDNAVASFYDPLYDLSDLEWSREMIDAADLDPGLMPETKWSSEVAGKVTTEAAAATGISAGTPVVTGAVDAIAALLSVGGVDHGDTVFMYGTTGVIYTTVSEPHPVSDLWSTPHCIEEMYAVGGGMATSGAITEWFVTQFADDSGDGAGDSDPYDRLTNAAAGVDPGSDGLMVLPYFSGSRTPLNDERARGAIAGLTLSHTKAHVYRAILEGVGYGFRHNLEAMKAAGVPIGRTFAVGGGARSGLWRQIVSDITGAEQAYVSDSLGAPLGSAYLAGIGTGIFDGVDRIRASATVSTTTPDPDRVATYEEYYDVYRELYPSMREEIHRLSELGDG